MGAHFFLPDAQTDASLLPLDASVWPTRPSKLGAADWLTLSLALLFSEGPYIHQGVQHNLQKVKKHIYL